MWLNEGTLRRQECRSVFWFGLQIVRNFFFSVAILRALFMSPSPHFSWLSIIRRANKTKILYPRDLRTFSPCCDWRSQDSSVGIMIRLWARLPKNNGSILCRDRMFVSSPEGPYRLWGWLIPLFIGYWNLSTAGGGKLTSHLCRMLRLISPHTHTASRHAVELSKRRAFFFKCASLKCQICKS